ncbi:cation-efflux pump [Paraconexibacter antarcticus]|uniref:Cation-efflux pump n=1 Tax=Paraconexibacter antarcticus TaxID=2949664 RepID=A0ABY5DSA6_9ACTN|nr:cation-efflux pump [Paraconexibacter antarcticus]UTI64571.1 cation-efflux pump [Paraconexibacter antarcticus]
MTASGHQRTALASVLAALLLVLLKLGTGVATGSLGLISAGIESSGDVVAATLTLLAVRLGGRPADEDHPYGHRRAENLAALGEAAILAGGGVFIVVQAVGALVGGAGDFQAHWYVFAVIGVAIAIDVSRIAVSLRGAVRYESAALRSNAFHFGADMAGSVAVLGGLLLVAAGVRSGDALAALVVAGIIFAAAARLIHENALVLMDTTPEQAHAQVLEAVAAAAPEAEIQRLRVRESGGRYFADIVVGVSPTQRVVEGHETADAIEDAVHAALPQSDVVVHVEPGGGELPLREQVLAIALTPREVCEVHDVTVFDHDGGAIVTLHVKFDRDAPLAEAHRVANDLEDRLREIPEVIEARTHLEPLEPTRRRAGDVEGDDPLTADIEELARTLTGEGPRDVRLLRTRAGLVVLLDVTVDPGLSLRDAHDIAGRFEAALHARHPDVVEVVVHTEPHG